MHLLFYSYANCCTDECKPLIASQPAINAATEESFVTRHPDTVSRARLRWLVAYTLLRNPGLILHRKRDIQAAKAPAHVATATTSLTSVVVETEVRVYPSYETHIAGTTACRKVHTTCSCFHLLEYVDRICSDNHGKCFTLSLAYP